MKNPPRTVPEIRKPTNLMPFFLLAVVLAATGCTLDSADEELNEFAQGSSFKDVQKFCDAKKPLKGKWIDNWNHVAAKVGHARGNTDPVVIVLAGINNEWKNPDISSPGLYTLRLYARRFTASFSGRREGSIPWDNTIVLHNNNGLKDAAIANSNDDQACLLLRTLAYAENQGIAARRIYLFAHSNGNVGIRKAIQFAAQVKPKNYYMGNKMAMIGLLAPNAKDVDVEYIAEHTNVGIALHVSPNDSALRASNLTPPRILRGLLDWLTCGANGTFDGYPEVTVRMSDQSGHGLAAYYTAWDAKKFNHWTGANCRR